MFRTDGENVENFISMTRSVLLFNYRESRLPSLMLTGQRHRYEASDRRYRHDSYTGRSDSGYNNQLTSSQRLEVKLFLDKISYFDESNNKEALNFLAQCEARQKCYDKEEEPMKLLPDYPADSCMEMETMMKQPDTKLGDTADADKWKTKVLNMLESRFGSIISRFSTDIGRMKLHTLDVQVTEGSPVFMKQYTIPLKYQNFIDNETKRLEEAGLISRSLSNWSAHCMVVPKKQDPDNPHEVQLRMVIDYRQLNKRIITSRAPDRNGKIGKVILNYPIPTIESLLARLEGCKYFSILDLRSGYHHMGLSEQSKPLTAFTTLR